MGTNKVRWLGLLDFKASSVMWNMEMDYKQEQSNLENVPNHGTKDQCV